MFMIVLRFTRRIYVYAMFATSYLQYVIFFAATVEAALPTRTPQVTDAFLLLRFGHEIRV